MLNILVGISSNQYQMPFKVNIIKFGKHFSHGYMKFIFKICLIIISIFYVMQIWMLPQFLSKSIRKVGKDLRPPRIVEVKDSDAIHSCQNLEIGCFKVDPDFSQREFKYSSIIPGNTGISPQECFKNCSSRDYFYAAITQRNMCVCTSQPFEITKEMIESTNCEKRMPQNIMYNNQEMILYKLSDMCTNGLKEEFAPNRFIGCTLNDLIPGFIRESREKYQVPDLETCVLFCGSLNTTLAMIAKNNICRCGNATKISYYSLSHCEGENGVTVYRTLVPDYRCDSIKFLPVEERPLVALYSCPGSGNTWARYLIEQGSGIYTGSVYKDGGLVKIGYLGELIDLNRSQVIKDHNVHHPINWRPNYSKYIFLLRNPYDAILSEINRRHSRGHSNIADSKYFKGAKFSKVAKSLTSHWLYLLRQAVAGKVPFLVILFEEMVNDPIDATRRMIKFVDFVHLEDKELEERLTCLSQQTKGFSKREKMHLSFDPFTPKVKKSINKYIILANVALKEKNIPHGVLNYIRKP